MISCMFSTSTAGDRVGVVVLVEVESVEEVPRHDVPPDQRAYLIEVENKGEFSKYSNTQKNKGKFIWNEANTLLRQSLQLLRMQQQLLRC